MTNRNETGTEEVGVGTGIEEVIVAIFMAALVGALALLLYALWVW